MMVPINDPNVSIERANYIGADGLVITGFDSKWWENNESFKGYLQQFKDAGFPIAGKWGHHCEYENYCTRFNPAIHDWAITHQHGKMTSYWRVYVNSSTSYARIHTTGGFGGNLDVSQNQDSSITIKIRDLDYYEPAYKGGTRYNVSSVYEKYPASEFSWLYDESSVAYDVNKTQQESGSRLTYGMSYKLFIEDDSLYATIFEPGERDFNLYVLFYVPDFPSVYFREGREVWLDTLRNFLGNFSGYIDALVQNSGGFPLPKGDFNPEILRDVERKYGVDFSFDNWIHDIGPLYKWDTKHLVQYVFDRETYFIFKNYAKEKQEILHEHGVIYVPTSSDMRQTLWAMIEHVDSLIVNSFLDSHRIVRYGWNWATQEWAPSTIRLGIWNTYILYQDTSADKIREWGFYTADEALKWNPEGATITFWTELAGFEFSDEQWEALKDVTRYMQDRFKHVRMLPPDAERYTVARAYRLSNQFRYGPKIEINSGQIEMYPIYVKDLRWDSVPTDGCLVYDAGGGGIVDYVSQIDDTEAHEKIIQSVRDGATIAFSGNALRRTGVYYEETNIPNMLGDMFQTEGWTHDKRSGLSPHYLTFNGTFNPRYLNGSYVGGYWIGLRSEASANVIIGDFPYAGLYEAGFAEGRTIGYTTSSNPLKTFFTDAESATYGDEYSTRFFEYCAGKKDSFRLWDVGKTFVFKADESTYYALLVERYGISRDVPIVVYGTENARIVDMDTGEEIPNNSLTHLGAYSTKLLMVRVGGHL